MSVRFKFGDIIENGWASDSNPTKRGVYLWSFNRNGRMNPGKHVKLLYDDGRTGELRIADDDKMTVVGTIFDAKVAEAIAAKDAEIERLREALKPFAFEKSSLDFSRFDEGNTAWVSVDGAGSSRVFFFVGDVIRARADLNGGSDAP